MLKFTVTKMTFFAATSLTPFATTALSARGEHQFNQDLHTQLSTKQITPNQAKQMVDERGERWLSASSLSSI